MDGPDWRESWSEEKRKAVVTHITKLLVDAALGTSASGVSVPVSLHKRLHEAAAAFENAVFQRSFTKEQYAQAIKEKIASVSKTAHMDAVPAPIQLNTPKPQRASIHSPSLERMPSMLAVDQSPGLLIDQGMGSSHEDPLKHLQVPQNLYKQIFYPQRHINFIGVKSDGEEHVVVSVIPSVKLGGYKALKNTKTGFEPFAIEDSALSDYEGSDFPTKIKKYLNAQNPEMKYYYVGDTKMAEDLLKLEEKHPLDDNKKLKIAIIYSKAGQKSTKEMFSNSNHSEVFQEFLDTLGGKINLAKHEGYRGDMRDVEGDSYFTEWNDFQVMYHVSTMMNSEQHRRLIGNDVCVIFFQESTAFDPSGIELGQVPQIFAVVQPYIRGPDFPVQYRIASLTKINLGEVKPNIPRNNIFKKEQIKDFLLTKMANGKFASMQAPPMNRLFFVPRAASIADLAQKYPRENKRDQKLREKQEEKERKELARTTSDNMSQYLHVVVKQARNLIARDTSGTSDPYVIISVKNDQKKTSIQKKNLNPVWNEEFKFNLAGINITYTDLEIVVQDSDLLKSDFIGKVTIPLDSIQRLFVDENTETWYTLLPKDPNKTPKESLGEILLQLRIHGVTDRRSIDLGNNESPR